MVETVVQSEAELKAVLTAEECKELARIRSSINELMNSAADPYSDMTSEERNRLIDDLMRAEHEILDPDLRAINRRLLRVTTVEPERA